MDQAFHWDANEKPHPDASKDLWARHYASRGWSVLPLHTVDGGLCSCGNRHCKSPGKHPRTKHGSRDASTDLDQVRKWWGQCPDANIGIATGASSGLVVVDIDPRNGGDESYAQLKGEIPDAFSELLEVRSGSGGTHLWFQDDRGDLPCRSNLLPGIDIKASGGYVVAPPSHHAIGSRYRFVSHSSYTPPTLPPSLRNLITENAQAQGEGCRAKIDVDSLRVTDNIKSLIREGKPRGERSEAIFAALRAMTKAGHSDDEILAVLLDPENGLSEKPREKGEPWLRAEIGRARKKQDRAHRDDQAPPRVRRLADIEPEKVDWLWHPYIPIGKVTSIEGDPGVGKSWLTAGLASAVSRGATLPGGSSERKPQRVLVLTAEDGLADTLRPRLDALAADSAQIYGADLAWELNHNGLNQLRDLIEQTRPALVIIDPLVAFMGAKLDMHKANQVRGVMAGLADVAHDCNVAVAVVRHLTKGSREKALYRGLGSIDITAACRSVLMVAFSPDGDDCRIIAHTKSNLAPQGKSLSYTLSDGQFEWCGEVDFTAEDLCREAEDSQTRSARQEAVHFLKELLKDGPVPAQDVLLQAEEQGISKRTLDRAKRKLGVRSIRTDDRWTWELRQDKDQS